MVKFELPYSFSSSYSADPVSFCCSPRPKVTFDSPAAAPRRQTRTYKKRKAIPLVPDPMPPAPDKTVVPVADPTGDAIGDPISPTPLFDSTRPKSMKPTSNRKATGSKNPNPYYRPYLKKSLSLTDATWNTIHEALVTVFEQNMDLIGIQPDKLCARLNDIGLPEDVVALLPVTEDCKFLMYHIALLVRRKVSSQSALKQLAVLREVIAGIQKNTKELSTTVTDLKEQTASNTTAIGQMKQELKEVVADNNQVMLAQIRVLLKEEAGERASDRA